MHIVDLTNPDSPSIALTYHFNDVGDGEITDVAVCDDTVAVSIANNDRTLEGHVQYFLPFTSNDQSITKLSRVTGTYIVKDYITLQNRVLREMIVYSTWMTSFSSVQYTYCISSASERRET